MSQPPSLHKALAGDRQALEELAGYCYLAIYRYLHRLCGDREQAQDLAQDTMVRMLGSLHTWQPRAGTGFMAYVFRIAHNRFIDEVRGSKRLTAWVEPQESGAGPPGADTTSMAALSAIEAAVLRQALESLSPGDRELLELRYYYGFSHREAAAILGLTPPVVKSRLNAALGRLRKLVAADEKESRHGT